MSSPLSRLASHASAALVVCALGLVLAPPAGALDPPAPWPGSQSVVTVDDQNVLGGDVSGLDYEPSGTAAPGVLWAVDNSDTRLLRMLWDGTRWVRDTAHGWSLGKTLRYPDGTGRLDSEDVTLTGAGAAGGVYVSSESNLDVKGVSRNSVLRYDVSGDGTTLNATREWDLTGDLPVVGVNKGAEALEWVPDQDLVRAGFVDEKTGAAYDPATYPGHGTGLFFVGLEADGVIYAYALDQVLGGFTRVATIVSGYTGWGALHWEPETRQLWVVCDNNCTGRVRIFEIDPREGPTKGRFVAVKEYERPTGMANLNNEGFTAAPSEECAGGFRPVFWADDGNTDGHVLRAGTFPCTPKPPPDPTPDPTPDPVPDPVPDPTPVPDAGPAPAPVTGATATAPLVVAPQTVPPDTVAPQVTAVALSATRFRVGARATALSAAQRPPAGTTIGFTLSEPGAVTVVIEQSRPGRRLGRRCVAPTPARRHLRACRRQVRVGTLRRTGHAGRNTIAFSGRLARRALAPGSYRLRISAVDAAGNVSTPRSTAFRIVPG